MYRIKLSTAEYEKFYKTHYKIIENGIKVTMREIHVFVELAEQDATMLTLQGHNIIKLNDTDLEAFSGWLPYSVVKPAEDFPSGISKPDS